MTTPLSPAAQAVLDATGTTGTPLELAARGIAAAALRAAADQVVPEPPVIVEGGRTYEEAWTATVHDDIRRRFLAFAAELVGDAAVPADLRLLSDEQFFDLCPQGHHAPGE